MKLSFSCLPVGIFLTIVMAGCEATVDDFRQSSLDARMIGTWEGEREEQDGTIKRWAQTRKENGSYLIEFSFKETDGTLNRFTEEGKWWIKDGLFHEIVPSWMEHPDSYKYHIKDRCVEFLLVSSNASVEDIGQYSFVECLSDKTPVI